MKRYTVFAVVEGTKLVNVTAHPYSTSDNIELFADTTKVFPNVYQLMDYIICLISNNGFYIKSWDDFGGKLYDINILDLNDPIHFKRYLYPRRMAD